MKKLFAVVLCLLLATGAAYAYDTKIIDEGTNLINLHESVRPIGHYGTATIGTLYGPRVIGVGHTVEDPINYPGPAPVAGLTGKLFFVNGSRVGVSDTLNNHYVDAKRYRLAAGDYEGDTKMNLQQAESTAVWRAIPAMTGTLMSLCGSVGSYVGQQWFDGTPGTQINYWPLTRESARYTDWWGNSTRTPSVHPANARYGYAVPRIEARVIANALFGNPGTNMGTEVGQETMTSVFVWSADRVWSTDLDRPAEDSVAPTTVAAMVRLDNDLYKGMKVSDLNVIKVEENKGARHWEFTRVDSASQLRNGTFAVVLRNTTASPVRDVVVNGDHIIGATSRSEASGEYCPTTCDVEWLTMQYFVLVGVEKGTVFDVADASYEEVIGGLQIVVAERPFTKTPNLCCSYPDGTEPRFAWVYGNRSNASERHDGFTRDPFVADPIIDRGENMGYGTLAGYPTAIWDTVNKVYGMEKWNQMYFVTDAVVDSYGFKDARENEMVYRLPAARAADVPAGKTALVMYTIRLGNGAKELAPESFVGKTPADIRVIDVRSTEAPEEMTEFTRAVTAEQLTDGHFAILKPNPLARHEQVIVPEDEKFVDGIYFVALAVKDNGPFDLDKFSPLSNNQSWVSPAFMVIGGQPEPTPTIEPTPTVEPTPTPVHGDSGGGCSVGGFGPASLFLLAPLFLLLKK